MEYQAILIHEPDKDEEISQTHRMKKSLSLPNGSSSSRAKEKQKTTYSPSHVQENSEYESSEAESARDYEVINTSNGQCQEERESDDAYLGSEASFQYSLNKVPEASFQYSLNLIERRLDERRQVLREEGPSSSTSIFRLPNSLVGINEKAQEPEIVSIGPYHRGKEHLLKFEDHKWSFLDKLIYQGRSYGRDLGFFLERVMSQEARIRECYSDVVLMSSHDFVEMMLLDSCFIIELIRHLGESNDVIDEDDPIFTRPWLIPILLRDLLKLENQLPFFVIESIFIKSKRFLDGKIDHLQLLALKVFDLAFPRSLDIIYRNADIQPKHLLDLFYQSLLPQNRVTSHNEPDEYHPSNHSIQCVAQLRPSGVKFRAKKAESFLEIGFQRPVLEIPAITINDFTSTVLINCVALEQSLEDGSNYFSEYVSFMNCLINQPRDVAFLCSDGIITRFSQDDHYVANFFNDLGKNVVFNIRNCYLSKQFKEVEAYYSSNWAVMMRTYFSSPWSFISVFSAFFLILLTIVQTIMSILSYKYR